MKAIALCVLAALAASAAWGAGIDSKVVAANNGFGFRMLGRLLTEKRGTADVVISPASLALALSMTYNGASGSTKTAMAKALGYEGIDLAEVNAGSKALLGTLGQPGAGIELSVANSLWARKDVQFKPDFLKRNKDYYQAKVTTLNFADPSAPKTINAWVSEKTHGKIDSIVGGLSRDDILYLINAVYFNGLWSAPFDAALTEDDPFTTASGRTNNVPMMRRTGHYDYLEGDGFQLISLPYGMGRISMYVLLPVRNDQGSLTLLPKLTPDNITKWLTQVSFTRVVLTMPKFKLEMKFDREMESALTALGMGVAFDPGKADFHAMCRIPPTPNVYIGQVVHKTYIDVNEKGTEAAAATSVGVKATAAPRPEPPVVMTVDHPFFFMLRDNESGELLFLGYIADPRPPVAAP